MKSIIVLFCVIITVLSSHDVLEANHDVLEGSNMIGASYDIFMASPICETSLCIMKTFRANIFALNYTNVPYGSCTTKYIPQHTNLRCVSSFDFKSKTEKMSSLNELFDSSSTTTKIDISGEFEDIGGEYSYSKSESTKEIINSIIKKKKTLVVTKTYVTTYELSMFEPAMQLSDEFIYTIKHMPVGNFSDTINRYVRSKLIDKFGPTYISKIMLGGIGQNIMTISKEKYDLLEESHYSITEEAGIELGISVGYKKEGQYDKTKHDAFMNYVETSETQTLGGDSGLTDFNKWITTIEHNSIPIYLELDWTPYLLTETRFPDDKDIENKRINYMRAIALYAKDPLQCPNNCSNHGVCEKSAHFNTGFCKCNFEFSGIDCSEKIDTSAQLYSGSICGHSLHVNVKQFMVLNYIPQPPFAESNSQATNIECDGKNAMKECPIGFTKFSMSSSYDVIAGNGPDYSVVRYTTITSLCRLNNDQKRSLPVGTLCGLSAQQNNNALCANQNPYIACPNGYTQFKGKYDLRLDSGIPYYQGNIAFCWKNDESIKDVEGTLCGVGSEHSYMLCGTNDPNSITKPCPFGYSRSIASGNFGFSHNLKMCIRN